MTETQIQPIYTYLLESEPSEDHIQCASIAGERWFPKGVSIPKCVHCDKDLTLFFQLVTQEKHQLPFKVGSRLAVYSCIEHEDIPLEQYTDSNKTVVAGYNELLHQQYAIMLIAPDVEQEQLGYEDKLIYRPFYSKQVVEKFYESGEFTVPTSRLEASKVGGCASWMNYEVNLNCPCGGKLQFLCQLAWNFDFHYGPQRTDYLSLFNGNHIFFLACDQQCSPYAVIPVCDN